MDSMAGGEEVVGGRTVSQCLVAIGRLQVTSSPNSSDLMGTNGNANEFISRHSIDGKFTFVDQRYMSLASLLFHLPYIPVLVGCIISDATFVQWEILFYSW